MLYDSQIRHSSVKHTVSLLKIIWSSLIKFISLFLAFLFVFADFNIPHSERYSLNFDYYLINLSNCTIRTKLLEFKSIKICIAAEFSSSYDIRDTPYALYTSIPLHIDGFRLLLRMEQEFFSYIIQRICYALRLKTFLLWIHCMTLKSANEGKKLISDKCRF